MRFPLFQSHIDFAHRLWIGPLRYGGVVIDATMGNGHDTLFLASSLFPSVGSERSSHSRLIGIDIDERSEEITRRALREFPEELASKQIELRTMCHTKIDTLVPPSSTTLITYNLGYLPGGGDKGRTTRTEQTVESVMKAMALVRPGGLISITCYPGHPEGQKEFEALHALLVSFDHASDRTPWHVTAHSRLYRWAPVVLLLQRGESRAIPPSSEGALEPLL